VKRQHGMTLVELVVAIVIIAMAGAALIGTLSYLSSSSGTTMRQAQAQARADAWLAQITGKSFADPDGVDGEANYLLFDDVNDYVGFSVVEAGNFTVRAAINAGTLTGIPNNAVWRVDVTVDYDTNLSAVATGYRTDHP
jgi:MSHA pilin protein MshD